MTLVQQPIYTSKNAAHHGLTNGQYVKAHSYDKYIVAFSGGKDSLACFLYLLDLGIPVEKVELWHHLIDGKGSTFMDWEVTENYCQKFADHFGVKIYFSWKQGGFKREMLRNNTLTAPTEFETPEGIKQVGGKRGKPGTREKFPQVSANLSVRWRSAYLKIDVCAAAIRNQERFKGLKTVVLSGERGEESDKNFLSKPIEERKGRGAYAISEPDRADLRASKTPRLVDRWRPIRNWKESDVWAIIEKYKVVVHPCYYMGWSRCSCKFCIFGNADQFASAYNVSPQQGNELIKFEKEFGVTIKRDLNLTDLISKGKVYDFINEENKRQVTSHTYRGKIVTENWQLPSGAYGESCGPI